MSESEPRFTSSDDELIKANLAGLEGDAVVSDTKFEADAYRRVRLEALGDILNEDWRKGLFSKDVKLAEILTSIDPELEVLRTRIETAIEEGFVRPEMTVRNAESLISRTIDKFGQDFIG